MAKSVAEFHARANLDSSEFDTGAANMAKSMYEAARSIDNAWGLIETGSIKSAKASAAVFARSGGGAIDSFGSQFDAARIDQAAASNKSLTAEMSRVTNSARASASVFEEHAAAATRDAQQLDRLAFTQERVHRGFVSGAIAVRGMGQASQFTSGAASRFGVVAQQIGYQVQDFAIQVAGGQNKMVAFAQQGSQLVSFFGPYGAIAGAVLNAGVMIYRLWDTTTEKTEKSIEAIKEYRKVLAEMANDRKVKGFEALDTKGRIGAVEQRIRDAQAGIVASRMGLLSAGNVSTPAEAQQEILKQVELSKVVQDSVYELKELKKKAASEELAGLIYNDSVREESLKSFLAISEAYDKESRDKEARNDAENKILYQKVDAIRDQLDLTRKLKREAQEIGTLRADKNITPAEAKQAVDNLVKSPTSIPASMQVTAGASALGGSFADGGMVLDIQKNILRSVEETVSVLREQLRIIAGT